MIRSIIALAVLASASAYAQTQTLATQQVQLLGPQLVVFAGSTANFDSLVTGLTTGAPITLNTVAADGSLQVVTFLPGTRLTPTDAARILETVRQNLIARGIATPTGHQIAAALVGGTLTSPSGTSPITGLLTGSRVPATPIQIRTAAAFTPGSTLSANLTMAELQAIRNALPTNDTESAQSLQLAAVLLAQQGILDPTADQLRAALFGGTLVTSTGRTVPLQGVLQGRVRNTSDSPSFNTSASPSFNTSASPPVNTSVTPIRTPPTAASAGQSVAPRTAGQR